MKKIIPELSLVSDFLYRQSWSVLTTISVMILLVISSVDYLTAYEISFSLFYLFPVLLALWYLAG